MLFQNAEIVFAAGIVGVVVVVLAGASSYVVDHQTIAIVQRFGKLHREAGPGLHVRVPFVDRVVGRVSLRVQQLEARIDTKTDDDVFVHLVVAVQYRVLPEDVGIAFYKLDDPTRQITARVLAVVRSQIPKVKLDDLFAKKDEIADLVRADLSQAMQGLGYGILAALVTHVEPDLRLKESMSRLNAAQRSRLAATERGEAERILKVKAAEGDAQSEVLHGRSVAERRRALVAGLRESVDEFRRAVPGTSARDAISVVLMTQYFDMLKDIGASSRSSTILIPHSPESLGSLTEQMQSVLVDVGHAAKGADGKERLRSASG